ncbi:TAXI family TRAP transporter solute-binding subunit [uncultured Hoeflea sp.]|uniref:TAXI family TRAP transporter solute-binding subunit n=1 Tax=uncultured Hoeflea sp. TaxID=538666 RepID=UPI0030EE37E5|tara:strand:+ start:16612 stop:17619 length:1008 start_codon:yes stop_codon:yes gene_type:complete
MLNNFKQVIAAAALAVSFGFATDDASAQSRITIGTNPQGSLYYTIGGGMAAALQERLKRQVTVQPFTGSSVYLPLIAAGELTLGLNSSIDINDSYSGTGGKKPLDNLRVVARLWPLRMAFIVRADSDMRSVADLKGKRTVTEFASLAAVSQVNVATLEAAGLSVDDVEPVTVSGLSTGLEALTENQLDATSAAIGIPMVQQANAGIPGGIRYLTLEGDNATKAFFDKRLPGLYPMTVNANPRMPEITDPVVVSAFDVYLTVGADTADEDVQAILGALYDAFPQLQKDYPPLRGGAQDMMSAPTNTAPYHSGAVAYWKEHGMWTDENDALEASLAK